MAIGETFLGAVLQVIFDRLASKEVIHLFNHSKIDESLVNKLKSLMFAAGKLLVDAEQKQLTDPLVKKWLDDLKHWFFCAEEVVDDINTEALRLSMEGETPIESRSFRAKVCNWIPAFSSSSTFAKTTSLKISNVVGMLDFMLSRKDALGLREVSVGRAPPRMPTTCLLEDSRVYGMEKDRNKLLEFLLSQEAETISNRIGVVALVGMGGLGKTTLAKQVYQDERLKDIFDLKAWVCVSDQFDIVRVTKSILDSIPGSSNCNSQDLNALQLELRAKLREKRFLLVLDDVWNENYGDWERLRAPFDVGGHGSKIIVTTRNEDVASIMRTAPVIRPELLSDADGWSLFKRHAFELGTSTPNPSLELIGREIVSKCHGLPLAIKTVGGLLRCVQGVSQWKEILECSIWDLPGDKSDVVPALWVSYYYLPSHLKRCFSFCAIFPKDCEINKTKLVYLWMAEDLVWPAHGNNKRRIEDTGEDYFHQLLSRSFLQPTGHGEAKFVMHDLIHDLAEAVSGKFVARQESNSPTEISTMTRQFLFTPTWLNPISKFEAISKAKSLRTFTKLEHKTERRFRDLLSSKLCTELIPELCCLRALVLPLCGNIMLPESVGNLKHLRYLNFSATDIKELPESMSRLYNLQVLLLSYCERLKRLPEDMSRLVSLRHLDITGTYSLVGMPKNMSKLTSLQTLTGFIVGKHMGTKINELGELLQIRGKLALRSLQNVSDAEEALEARLSHREYIDELALEFDTEEIDESEKGRLVLENLKPHFNLRRLRIRNYAGTRFPIWLDAGCRGYVNLTFLCITDCLYCFCLPPVGQLPSLKELEIKGLPHIRTVGPEFYGNNNSELSNSFQF